MDRGIGTAGAAARATERCDDEPAERCLLNGHPGPSAPANLNLSFAFVEGEALMMGIKDIAVSSGSACTSASLEPSYVLKALAASATNSPTRSIRLRTRPIHDRRRSRLHRGRGRPRSEAAPSDEPALRNGQGRHRSDHRAVGQAED